MLELIIMDTLPSMFGKFATHAWRYWGGLNKKILYQFIKGQSHLDMLWGAKNEFQ